MHLSRAAIQGRYRINTVQLAHLLADPTFPKPIKLATHALRWPLAEIEDWEKTHTIERPAAPCAVDQSANAQWLAHHQYRAAIFAVLLGKLELQDIQDKVDEALDWKPIGDSEIDGLSATEHVELAFGDLIDVSFRLASAHIRLPSGSCP